MRLKDRILWFGHPILGSLVIFFLWLSPVISILWFVGYVTYEIMEFIIWKDTADIDIRDFLIGMVSAGVILLSLMLWRSIWDGKTLMIGWPSFFW